MKRLERTSFVSPKPQHTLNILPAAWVLERSDVFFYFFITSLIHFFKKIEIQ